MLVCVVRIAMQNRVHSRLAHGHRDMRNCILIEPGPCCNLLSSQLNLINAVQRRIKGKADTACR